MIFVGPENALVRRPERRTVAPLRRWPRVLCRGRQILWKVRVAMAQRGIGEDGSTPR